MFHRVDFTVKSHRHKAGYEQRNRRKLESAFSRVMANETASFTHDQELENDPRALNYDSEQFEKNFVVHSVTTES